MISMWNAVLFLMFELLGDVGETHKHKALLRINDGKEGETREFS